ncbi:MAG: SufS family cysteine desulfurase [Rhodospirillales bacterium]|nr:SufS family cysteine desulfurase [Rhodospirillales bacterium]
MSSASAALRRQFPILTPGLAYLDSAASAQMPVPVLDAVRTFETSQRANVKRGVHRLAEAATEAYAQARGRVAAYLSVPADEIVFTGGTTASINLVAHAFGSLLKPGDEIVLSGLEHHANLVPWQMLAARGGITLRFLPITGDGRIDLSALPATLGPRTKLVTLAHVSNVTGAIVDTAPVVAAAKAVGARVLLDGAQRVPHGPVDIGALGIDFYAFSGHKLFAPHGVGVLWAKAELLDAMPPFMGGGEMIARVELSGSTWAKGPAKFEAGTPPIGAAVGMGAACDWLSGLPWAAIAAEESRLTQRLLDGLQATPGVRILGPSGLQGRAPVVSFDLAGAHPHDVCQIMDSKGVALRGGHHCAQPLHGRFDLAGSTRASLALYSDDSDVDRFFEGLAEARRVLL